MCCTFASKRMQIIIFTRYTAAAIGERMKTRIKQ